MKRNKKENDAKFILKIISEIEAVEKKIKPIPRDINELIEINDSIVIGHSSIKINETTMEELRKSVYRSQIVRLNECINQMNQSITQMVDIIEMIKKEMTNAEEKN